jgi:uncharacterized membrane protein YfcA
VIEFLSVTAVIGLIIILVTHFIGAIAVFGSSLLAVPPLLMLYGPESLPEVVFILIVVGLLQSLLLAVRNWKMADYRLCGLLLVGSGIGVPLGMLSVSVLPGRSIMILLGFLTLAAGLSGLIAKSPNPEPASRRWAGPVAVVSGIIHGAFASGGTILVVYLQRALPEKDTFRATLSVYWTVLNAGFVGVLFLRMQPGLEQMSLTAFVAVLVLFITILADRLAKHFDRNTFQRAVSSLLVCSGVIISASQF